MIMCDDETSMKNKVMPYILLMKVVYHVILNTEQLINNPLHNEQQLEAHSYHGIHSYLMQVHGGAQL